MKDDPNTLKDLNTTFNTRLEFKKTAHAAERKKALREEKEVAEKKLKLQKRASAAIKNANRQFRLVSKVEGIAATLRSPNGEFDADSPNHHLMTLRAVKEEGVVTIVCVTTPKRGARRRNRTVAVYNAYSRSDTQLFVSVPENDLGDLSEALIKYLEDLGSARTLTEAIADAIARNTFSNHS